MFDLIIVTAANKAQAAGYRAQLKGKKNFLVLSDPGDRRAGSLGATVNALRTIKRKKLNVSRLLICHSGGDAKRTPAYAAMGKAFVPMPDGRSMLEHIVEAMAKLPCQSGVTVCCGDVIPRLDARRVKFSPRGVTGVAYLDGPNQARLHGVYVADKNDPGLYKVSDFLQKPDVKKGSYLVDTGIMHFDWQTAEKMLSLPIAGDIYEEFPKLLLSSFAPFHVSVVPSCDFFHIGSSRELLQLLSICDEKGKRFIVDSVSAPIESLGGDNIVTNVPDSYGPIRLLKGECLTSLPIGKDEWYHLKYSIGDSFKEDGLWEKHALSEKMVRVNHSRLLALRSTLGKVVRVSCPLRIDFAGGWSDTPPICEQEGGTVLAAAVTLNGRRPVKVEIHPRRDKSLKIISKDLGRETLIFSSSAINDSFDPTDWSCLVRAALHVTGFKFGSIGLDIIISADVPKGSGMGTSSILGSSVIAALLHVKRYGFAKSSEIDIDEVGEKVLRLERVMGTGGGWEDQFAGMTPGIKILTSSPGKEQKVKVEKIEVPKKVLKELSSRSILYFTGQKRMARNVLRRVLGFYEENPHGFAKILVSALKDNAIKAATALKRGDIDTFASCINAYWRDKKLLDAGSTNEKVDDMIDLVRPYSSAITLTGAGGGGFMYILASSPSAAVRIRKILEANPPGPSSKVHSFAFDDVGIKFE